MKYVLFDVYIKAQALVHNPGLVTYLIVADCRNEMLLRDLDLYGLVPVKYENANIRHIHALMSAKGGEILVTVHYLHWMT